MKGAAGPSFDKLRIEGRTLQRYLGYVPIKQGT